MNHMWMSLQWGRATPSPGCERTRANQSFQAIEKSVRHEALIGNKALIFEGTQP